MGITDSDQGSNVLKAARGSTSFVSNTYNTKESPSNLVLWAESHDTYSNSWGESKDDSISTIQKGYVMQASRKDASILYFARPQNNTNLGQVGDTSFKNDEVKAINTFNKKYATKSENVTANNGCFVNVRGSSGAAIVRLSGSSTRIEVPGLADGKYLDLISNNEFTVSDGAVSIPSNATYCILTSDAEEEIYKISGGIFREINAICEKSLLYAFQNQKRLIDGHMIRYVAEGEMLRADENMIA